MPEPGIVVGGAPVVPVGLVYVGGVATIVAICLGIAIEVVGVGCCAMFRLSAVIGCTCVIWLL